MVEVWGLGFTVSGLPGTTETLLFRTVSINAILGL